MLYVLSTSLYRSYQVDRFITMTEQQNARLRGENESLAEDFEYFQSDAYKEKMLKQNFGLVRPGEEVIILVPEGKKDPADDQGSAQAARQYYQSLSNPQKWFIFFFGS